MNKVSIYLLLNLSAEFDLICCLWWLTSVLCFVSFLTFRWEMLLTRLMYSSPKSPKSTTSSLVPSTVCFVSLQPFTVLPDAFSPARIPPVFCFIFCPRAGLLSLMGNCILLLVAYHKRSTLKPAEFFIVNLSISDLGMTLTLFPLAIPSSFSHRCVEPKGRMDVWAKSAALLWFPFNITSSLFVQISLNLKWEKRRKHVNKKKE